MLSALYAIEIPKLPIGNAVEWFINWLIDNLEFIFDFITMVLDAATDGLQDFLLWFPPIILLVIAALLIWFFTSKKTAIFSAIGLLIVFDLQLWDVLIETVILIILAVVIALIIGIPIGIWMTRNKTVSGNC